MSEFIKTFSKKTLQQFNKYRTYLENNNWVSMSVESSLTDSFFNDLYSSDPTKVKKAEITKMIKEQIASQKDTIKTKSDEFKLQNDLMINILDRVKFFVTKTEGDHHKQEFKKFIKECLSIIEIHTSRVDEYVNSVDISKIENQEVRSEEIKLTKECFSGVNKIRDVIDSLNIREDSVETTGIAFHDNKPCPLSMLLTIANLYPEVQRAVDALNLDFTTPPKNEMHIYNENAPKWNPDKHAWLQEKSTLQYYIDEFKKFREGINIDGYYINGWLYYHLNAFVTYVPEEYFNTNTGKTESRDSLRNPPFRDNEDYIMTNYELAKEQGKMLFLAATRRAAKTTLIASKLDHAATIGKQTLLCAGGSAKDLGQIEKNFKTTILNKNPAFATYNLTNDWSKKIELGIKTKAGKTIPLSTLNVVNTDSGGDKKSEVLAGYTPDEFVLDEALKAPFISQLEGLKPALDSPYGKRCVGILSGTGGNYDLAKDAMDVLGFPETHDILEMRYDILERGIPLEEITWRDDRRKFGTFIPAQMSAKEGMVKIDSNLADYLGKPDSEELRKIKIKVTDWKKCNEIIQKDREKKKGNRLTYTKELVYYPIKPSEIMLSGTPNPLPVEEAKAHRDYLLQTGKWDRRRELFRDSQGNIISKISTKDLIPYPHKGENIEAPFLLFEDIPLIKPAPFLYTGGGDDYKQDSSASDSVSTFYIFKQEVFGDPFSKKIVASISTKPEKHPKVYEQWHMLMEAFNLTQTAFIENEDFAIKEYLDRRHLTEKYLAPSVAFTQTFNISNNLKRAFGWSPAACKRVLFNLFIDYCNEEIQSVDENGNEITIKGVQRIDDIGLLEEIIQYSENGNYDRITAAMSAISYAHYLQSTWQTPKLYKQQEEEKTIKKTEHQRSFYTNPKRRRGFY